MEVLLELKRLAYRDGFSLTVIIRLWYCTISMYPWTAVTEIKITPSHTRSYFSFPPCLTTHATNTALNAV